MNEVAKAEARFSEAVALVQKRVPQFRTTFKEESRLHRAVGWVMAKLGAPDYMESLWTTLGYVMARPLVCRYGALPEEWRTVLHEGRHALDAKNTTRPLFYTQYSGPQSWFVPLAALALAAGSWAVAALAALCLLPLPSLGRTWAELRGYQVTLAAQVWYYGGTVGVDWVVDNFAGAQYYWMWPFRAWVRRRLENWVRAVYFDEAVLDPYLEDVRALALKYRAEDFG